MLVFLLLRKYEIYFFGSIGKLSNVLTIDKANKIEIFIKLKKEDFKNFLP